MSDYYTGIGQGWTPDELAMLQNPLAYNAAHAAPPQPDVGERAVAQRQALLAALQAEADRIGAGTAAGGPIGLQGSLNLTPDQIALIRAGQAHPGLGHDVLHGPIDPAALHGAGQPGTVTASPMPVRTVAPTRVPNPMHIRMRAALTHLFNQPSGGHWSLAPTPGGQWTSLPTGPPAGNYSRVRPAPAGNYSRVRPHPGAHPAWQLV